MNLDELKGHLQTAVELEWSVIPPYLCATWSLAGHSGSSRSQFFPVAEPGSTADNLTVTVEGSVIDFVGPTMSVLKCRADYPMTLAKVSSGALDR